MKRNKIFVTIIALLLLVVGLAACDQLHTHAYGSWEITLAPTETTTGTATHTCPVDGEVEEVTLPALNDVAWTSTVTEATCTTAGKTVYTSVYGTVEVVIEQLAHEYGAWTITTEPTVTAGGKASHVCSVGSETEEVDIPALNDATVWTASTTNATCTVAGETTYSSVYGTVEVDGETLPHQFGAWTITTEPTLTAGGKASHVCSVGNESEEVDIPALNDATVWTSTVTAATCLAAGKTVYTSVYGTVEVAIDQLSHNYGSWTITTEPTLTAAGKASHTCSVGEEVEEVDIPALNDATVWTSTVTAATCLAAGKTVYTSVYGTVEVAIDQLSHNYGAWTITTEPTLTEGGKASHVCSVGEEVEEVDIPALNDAVWTASTTSATCTVAGKTTYSSVYGTVEVDGETLPHQYGVWTITTEPTLTEGGKASHTCSECNESEEIDVPALNDSEVWTSETTTATYNAAGKTVYTSDYGTIEEVIAKLVAPYDNKTYYSFSLDSDEYSNRVVNMETAWLGANITLDANGTGVGTAHPFRGQMVIEMVNPETGEIKITTRSVTTAEDGTVTYGEPTTYKAYVDMSSGVIVRANNATFDYVHVMIPTTEEVARGTATASAWDKAMAITYTGFTTPYNIFIYDEVVYFGVNFLSSTNLAGIDAAACYNADGVYVEVTPEFAFGFGNNGEKLVLLDTLEGTYANGDNEDLVLSGFGTVTYQGNSGTYTKAAADATYDLDMYVNSSYYQVTLSSDYTYTLVQPEVTISFDAGTYATIDAVTVNMNIAYTLPTPAHDTQTFKGWYYDAECTQPVEDFVPTADITLYALWKAKVVIHLVGVIGEDPTTLYLGEGDVIGDYLPVYTVDTVAEKVFKGWYLDSGFDPDSSLPLDATVGVADTDISIYAQWVDFPAYYGTYKGANLYGYNTGGSNLGLTITIDANGVITGAKTGTVEEYDPTTGTISYKAKSTDTTVSYLYYNDESGILIYRYTTNLLSQDSYVFTKYGTTFSGQYAVRSPNTPTAYLRFIPTIDKDGKSIIVFVNRDIIYPNVSLSNTAGASLAVSDITNSKTLIVKDAEENIIFSVAAEMSSFNNGSTISNTVVLDSYYGNYTFEGKEIVLDGVGGITIGGVEGTYTLVEGENYTFDVYLNNNSEYYRLTMVEKVVTGLEKTMATLTFNVGDNTAIEAISVNINVAVTLPNAADEGWVFNGWYMDPEFTTPIADPFSITTDTVIYAKYDVPATLTINYNNGEESSLLNYYIGYAPVVDTPVYSKHKFVGWYTTPELTDGTEWVSGTALEDAATVIYAKWTDAEAYYNTYVPVQITGTTANGSTSSIYTRTGAVINVDPDGKAVGTAYPFRGDVTITIDDKTTGKVTLTLTSGTSITVYEGYIDASTGIIVINQASGTDKDMAEVMFLNPFETTNLTSTHVLSSYWNSGKTRTIEYTYNETTYRMFVHNNQVYFNVSFVDAEGVAVAGNACHNATTLYVNDSTGQLIAKFAHDGTTMQPLDGFEGTYSNGSETTLVIDGVKTVTLGDETGTYSAAADGATYTHDAYIAGSYYELTLNATEKTYTIYMPYVTITYDAGEQATVPSVTVNKNIAITLADPANENYVFRGWYLSTDETQTLLSLEGYVPTENVTLVAKWDLIVTVTVVYGKGLANSVTEYGVGDTIVLTKPVFTDGQVFEGWYTDEACETPYVEGEVTGTMTIYCKWKDAIALYGEYKGFETWGAGTSGGTIYGGNSTKSVVIDAEGNVSGGTLSGTIEDYNSTTGTFHLVSGSTWYYGYYDLTNGLLAVNYSSKNESLGSDTYVFVKGATTALTSASAASYWNAGRTRLMTVTLTGHSLSTVNVFICDGVAYWNVSWTSTDETLPTAASAYSANQLTVLDSTGEVIAVYVKGDSGLETLPN